MSYMKIEARIGVATINYCENGGTPANDVNCTCHDGFTGDRCQRYLGI